MSKIKLTGSNSGYVEISSAADAGNLTLNLPTSGTALLSNGDNVYTGITTFSNDLKLEGGSYDVLWDSSDNQLEFGDNAKISFGASSDLQIFHDGNHSRIVDSGTGNLILQTSKFNLNNNDGTKAFFHTSSTDGIELYHDNSIKFVTTNTGAVITGICTATSFSGSGEGLTRSSQYAHRNRIHNGGMTIAQRVGDTETLVSNNNWTKTLDRWKVYENTEANLTFTRTHGIYPTAGTNPSSYSSQRLKVTIADTSLSSSQQCMLAQYIEGFNWQDLRWGTSAAKSVTLSFSVLATGSSAGNVTGTYCVQCSNPNYFNRAYIKEYTIDAINVWKRVTLTFPGDTSGSWDTQNDASCRFAWFLAAGTDHHGSADSWGAFKATTSNQKNFLGNVNNMLFITDVQVEEGTVATPFETKPFSTELALCQRYYEKISPTGGLACWCWANNNGSTNVFWKVKKRTTPTVGYNGTLTNSPNNQNGQIGVYSHNRGWNDWGTLVMQEPLTDSVRITFGSMEGWNAGDAIGIYFYGEDSNIYGDAEF